MPQLLPPTGGTAGVPARLVLGLLFVLVEAPVPLSLSLLIPASSQKLAFRPPPEVFGAAKTQAAAGHAGVGQLPDAAARAGINGPDGGIHDAEQRDGRLRHGSAGCGQYGQGNQLFLCRSSQSK